MSEPQVMEQSLEDEDEDFGEDDDDIFIEADTPGLGMPTIEDDLGNLSGSSNMSQESLWQPPDIVQAEAALKDLKMILKPPRCRDCPVSRCVELLIVVLTLDSYLSLCRLVLAY